MGVVDLPVEIIQLIATHLDRWRDVASFASASRDLHAVVNPELYLRAARTHRKSVLFWAAHYNQPATLTFALDAGVDPDCTWQHTTETEGLHAAGLMYPLGDDETTSGEPEIPPWPRARTGLPPNASHVDYVPGSGYMHGKSRPRYWTALHIAAERGHSELLQILLDRGANIEPMSEGFCQCSGSCGHKNGIPTLDPFSPLQTGRMRWSPLQCAIRGGSQSTFEILLAHQASPCFLYDHAVPCNGEVSREPGCYFTALHAACQFGRMSMAQYLVDNNLVAGLDNHNATAPLAHAYLEAQWPCLEWMVSRGAPLPWEILLHAVTAGCFDDACHLIDLGIHRGVDVGGAGHALLLFACGQVSRASQVPYLPTAEDPRLCLVERLLDIGASLDPSDGTRGSALGAACSAERNPEALVAMLLKAGAPSDYRDRFGKTALARACALDPTNPAKLPIIKLLFEYGAQAEIDAGFLQPFKWSIESGDSEVCRFLFTRCTGMLFNKNSVKEIFDYVLEGGSTPILRLLLEFDRENYIVKDKTSVARLIRAITWSRMRASLLNETSRMDLTVVNDLLDRGALCHVDSGSGLKNPLSEALRLDCDATLLQKMVANGADPHGSVEAEDDPLCLAAAQTADEGQFRAVEVLLDAGAQVYRRFPGVGRQDAPRNPLVLAIGNQRGDCETVRLMLNRQPLRYQDPGACIQAVLGVVFSAGANYALNLMLSSDPNLETLLRRRSTKYLHVAIDTVWGNIVPTLQTVESIQGTLDNIRDLVHRFSADVEASCEMGMKAADKVMDIVSNDSASSSSESGSHWAAGAIYTCFRQQIRFGVNEETDGTTFRVVSRTHAVPVCQEHAAEDMTVQ